MAHPRSGKPTVSVVIPLLNEAQSLRELHRRTVAVFSRSLPAYSWELILINDGSTDDSPIILHELASLDERVQVINFTRNFGQHPALMAGFSHARGKYVISMDADLQNPPEEIPKLIPALEAGYDIVYGVRAKRRDSLGRRLGSYVFQMLVWFLTGIKTNDVVAPLRGVSRKVVMELNRLPGVVKHPAIVTTWMGFSSISVRCRHEAREFGVSHYSYWKALKMTVELAMGFTPRLLRLITWFGLMTSLSAFTVGTYFVWSTLFYARALPGFTSIIVCITFFFGVTFIFLGILAEYLAQIFLRSLGRPPYVIDSIVHQDGIEVIVPAQRDIPNPEVSTQGLPLRNKDTHG